ncbi:MAG: helix-turn-helix domain-containing protein [Nannocystales bacterium]
MDPRVAAAAEALTRGDPLAALDRVALREDAMGLALRGTAMAQLGDFVCARKLLLRAREAGEGVTAARCEVALAEVEVALRELTAQSEPLVRAAEALRRAGDHHNAVLASLVLARRSLLLGRVEDAAACCSALDRRTAPPRLRAIAELVLAEVEVRRVRAADARLALERAGEALSAAPIPGLQVEVERALHRLEQPAARLVQGGEESWVDLHDVESLRGADVLVVDACRRSVRGPAGEVSLARRAVPFALLQGLARSWPRPTPREALILDVFGARRIQETDRVKLRVELGRLRALIEDVAGVEPEGEGYVLRPRAGAVALLVPPFDGPGASVRALLADGAAWSTAALAAALGVSVRTAQRMIKSVVESGAVAAVGLGKARRWVLMPSMALRTPLLLPRHDA